MGWQHQESDWQLASQVLDSMTLQKIQGNSVMYAASDWQMSLAQGLRLRAGRNLAPMILSFKSGWRRCVAGWMEATLWLLTSLVCIDGFYTICPLKDPQRFFTFPRESLATDKVDFFWASFPSIFPDVFSSSALMNQLQRWQQWDVALAHLEMFQGNDQQLYHAGIAALKESPMVGWVPNFEGCVGKGGVIREIWIDLKHLRG